MLDDVDPIKPRSFETLPAIGDHHVGRYVGVVALSESFAEQSSGVSGQRLAELDAMVNDGLGSQLVQSAAQLPLAIPQSTRFFWRNVSFSFFYFWFWFWSRARDA